MQQFQSLWSGLAPAKRVTVILASLAMFAAVLGLARMATQPGMALLYAGLDGAAAGEVVQALESRGAAYDIRGDAIFVDSARRDELRMVLAGEGMPAKAAQGYELLDGLTGFGTTSQMFDAAYWRAREGELARTIVASPAVQMARVHIANPGTKPFQRDIAPSASVTVTPAAGGIGAGQARALRFLVASAVAGLDPADVSVIDASSGTVLGAEATPGAGSGGADRAAALKRNVERLLEARVGYGRAVVEVNVETVTERERVTERRVDPESRVAISQETTETARSARDQGGGEVTVASNLPTGDGAQGDSSQSEDSETRERVNYEVSELQRETTREPGAIRRVTTAVLVDGIMATGPDGAAEWQPRPEAEMAALRELVASAVGFDEARGDTLTLKTMQFEPLPIAGSEPASGLSMALPIDAMRLAQLGILGLVTLLIGLFVLRPILGGSRAAAPPQLAADPALGMSGAGMGAGMAGAGMAGAAGPAALTGEIQTGPEAPGGPLQVVGGDGEASPGATDAGDGTSAVDRLRALIDERQAESIEILRSWMEDDSETERA